MKALVVSALSPDLSGTALVEVPEPEARAGQVLIRVRAAALNYPDLLMTRGEYQMKPPLPFSSPAGGGGSGSSSGFVSPAMSRSMRILNSCSVGS